MLGEKLSAEDVLKSMSEPERLRIHEMNRDSELYQHLIDSLFPTICGEKCLCVCVCVRHVCCVPVPGNDEVKRGVLLMLFGGVAKTTIEGTRLRGDINVCIVGDPSCAKSQFLK